MPITHNDQIYYEYTVYFKLYNMILSDFFEGDEVYCLYSLKDEPIIILYNILCIILFTICICDDRYYECKQKYQ